MTEKNKKEIIAIGKVNPEKFLASIGIDENSEQDKKITLMEKIMVDSNLPIALPFSILNVAESMKKQEKQKKKELKKLRKEKFNKSKVKNINFSKKGMR